jgi:NAD(P)-dependent dehydrogenase (short-subunit alcohol dehydrogenase family)
VGDRRAGAGRSRRRDRPRHRHAGRSGRQVWRRAAAHRARRHRPRRRFRRRGPGLDIVVNNAGYGQFGFIEELSEEEARAQIETNVFGALWITQAALPYLRAQRSGHIIQVSSIGGITAFQNVGIYHASKWALEGFSQALAQEVASFGVHVTLIEPGARGSAARPQSAHVQAR